MIEKLKYAIDLAEDKPKIKTMLLSVAELPEDKQEIMLTFIEEFIRAGK